MASLLDPFRSSAAVCVPDYPTVPSRKMYVYSRGFCETGTAGFGFVLVNPFRAVASDVDCVFYSNNAYTGTLTSATAGVGVVAARSNSDYVNTDLAATSVAGRYRIVSAGLRLRYAGTELNRGGVAVGYQQTMHRALDGLSFQQFDTAPSSRRFRPDQKWLNVTFCPTLVSELEYSSAAPAGLGQFFLGFAIQSPVGGSSASYEWEIGCNYELNGVNVRDLTPSYGDPSGIAVVTSTLTQDTMQPYAGDPKTQVHSKIQQAETVARSTLSGYVHEATDVVKGIGVFGEALLDTVGLFF